MIEMEIMDQEVSLEDADLFIMIEIIHKNIE
jgi:hypothetical protein